MGFNIVDLITEYAGGEITNQIAGAIGGDAQQTQKALSGAIPGLLSGLLESGSTESGARALFNAVNDQDDGVLDSLGTLLSGGNHSQLMSAGSGILGSLLGNGNLGNIVRTLGGFSGLSRGSSNSLMGLLAPIVFGLVKRKLMGGGGLNVGGLMDMFTGQKDNINAAMPSGFSMPAHAASNVIDTVEQSRPSALKKFLPLLVIVGIAYFGYNYLMNKNKAAVSVPAVGAVSENIQIPSVNVDNIQNEFRSSLGGVVNSLTGITDVASARAAVPNITAATASLNSMSGIMGSVPADARQGMSQVLAATLPNLQSLVEKANAIPGVQGVIAPALEKMTVALGAFE